MRAFNFCKLKRGQRNEERASKRCGLSCSVDVLHNFLFECISVNWMVLLCQKLLKSFYWAMLNEQWTHAINEVAVDTWMRELQKIFVIFNEFIIKILKRCTMYTVHSLVHSVRLQSFSNLQSKTVKLQICLLSGLCICEKMFKCFLGIFPGTVYTAQFLDVFMVLSKLLYDALQLIWVG